MMKDETNGKLTEALKFAKSINMLDSLNAGLSHLENLELEYPGTEMIIYADWAPYSFEFAWVNEGVERGDPNRIRMNGGLIFHGAHDGGGSGAYITSVCLTPTNGWSIHT